VIDGVLRYARSKPLKTDFGPAAYAEGPLSFDWFDPNTAESTCAICAGMTEKL